jgi:hypothetical protein
MNMISSVQSRSHVEKQIFAISLHTYLFLSIFGETICIGQILFHKCRPISCKIAIAAHPGIGDGEEFPQPYWSEFFTVWRLMSYETNCDAAGLKIECPAKRFSLHRSTNVLSSLEDGSDSSSP